MEHGQHSDIITKLSALPTTQRVSRCGQPTRPLASFPGLQCLHCLIASGMVGEDLGDLMSSRRIGGGAYLLGKPNKIYSMPVSFGTCCLNCHYHLPNNDTPTENATVP